MLAFFPHCSPALPAISSEPHALESTQGAEDMLATFGCEICMSLLSRRSELRWTRNHGKNSVCSSMQGFDIHWHTICEHVASAMQKYDAWVHLWEEYYGYASRLLLTRYDQHIHVLLRAGATRSHRVASRLCLHVLLTSLAHGLPTSKQTSHSVPPTTPIGLRTRLNSGSPRRHRLTRLLGQSRLNWRPVCKNMR